MVYRSNRDCFDVGNSGGATEQAYKSGELLKSGRRNETKNKAKQTSQKAKQKQNKNRTNVCGEWRLEARLAGLALKTLDKCLQTM